MKDAAKKALETILDYCLMGDDFPYDVLNEPDEDEFLEKMGDLGEIDCVLVFIARMAKEGLAENKSAAQVLGRLGGLRGGHARARSLTRERRSEIARMAALARWGR